MEEITQLTQFLKTPSKYRGVVAGVFDENIVMFDTRNISCCIWCIQKRILASSYRDYQDYKEYSHAPFTEELGMKMRLKNKVIEVIKTSPGYIESHEILGIPGCKCTYGQ